MPLSTKQNNSFSQEVISDGSQTVVLEPSIPEVAWTLSAYQRTGDDLVSEWPLPGMSMAVMQDLFEQPRDNPMYDGYLVMKEQAERLQAYTDHIIDLQAYDYFVECYAK